MIATLFLPHARSTAGLRGLLAQLGAWRRRIDQRRQLQSLDDRMLADIGLTRAEIEREAQKPFWRP